MHGTIDFVRDERQEAARQRALLDPEEYVVFARRFGLDRDANFEGNVARWINHSCAPNCQAWIVEHASGDPRKDRVVIESRRRIRAGEELTYDYGIVLEERQTAELKRIWACRCGAPRCTGTLLKPKRARKA